MSRRLGVGQYNQYRWGLQDEKQFHNRIYVGQISYVDTNRGTIDVVIGSAGKKEKVVIPLLALSANGFQSAWMRFMPAVGDYVQIGFGADNSPHVLGYATWGHEDFGATSGTDVTASGYRVGGYATLSKLRAKNVAGLREFVQLKPGEWDMRSSGGAYMRGSRNGTLLFATGSVSRTYDKVRSEIRDSAAMYEYDEGGIRIRLGDVKRRLLVTDFVDKAATPAGKAWEVDIAYTSTPVTTNHYYEHRIGDVRDDTIGAYEPGITLGSVLRVKQRVFDGLIPNFKTESYSFLVDNLGNVSMQLAPTATTHTQAGPAATWEADYLNLSLSATLSAALTGAQVHLGAETGVHPLLLSNVYRPAETTMHSVLGTSHTAYGTFFGLLIAGWASVTAFMTAYAAENITSPSGIAATTAAGTGGAIAAGAAAATGAATLASGALTTFEAGSATYLSPVVKTV